jgi:hypothetical protein
LDRAGPDEAVEVDFLDVVEEAARGRGGLAGPIAVPIVAAHGPAAGVAPRLFDGARGVPARAAVPESIGWPPEAFTLQETVNLLTPLVVIPLAWLVFDVAGGLGRRGLVAFLVVAALWVEGQGIHLAANAIGDALPHDTAAAFYLTVPGDLDLWLDEVLSHWMWHVAWVGLSILMLAAATRSTLERPTRTSVTAVVAGLVHGATFFLVSVEVPRHCSASRHRS